MTDTYIHQTPTEWDMFGVYEDGECIARPGDEFVTAQMHDLACLIRDGALTRRDLYDEIRGIQKRTVEAGFGEVHDTEPEWAICDFVNLLCDEQGWVHVDRWEF
jgi:hypothetical protein